MTSNNQGSGLLDDFESDGDSEQDLSQNQSQVINEKFSELGLRAEH